MRYVEVKLPMFGEGGILSTPIQESWVGFTLANLAIGKAAKDISHGSAEFHNSIAKTVDMAVDSNLYDSETSYLRIVFGVEDDPEIFQEQIDTLIDAEVRKRKSSTT